MRLGKVPYAGDLGFPGERPGNETEPGLGLARFTDAGFPWFAPVGARILGKLENVVRDRMQRAGYAEFRAPAVSRMETVAPAGWLERFGGELLRLQEPFGSHILAATSEEPLLSFVGRGGLTSHRQLPMRLFEFREIFRFRDRAQGLYNSRQFACCLFASLDADHAGYLDSARHAQRAVRSVLDALDLRAEHVSDESSGGFEFVFPYERGDRPRSRTIPYHRNPDRPRTEDDDTPQGGLAMGYRYEHVEAFGVGFRDADNVLRTPVMGTYGIGMQRLLIALLEQHAASAGIAFPACVRPFDVAVLPVDGSPRVLEAAERVYGELSARGLGVVLDDRANLRLPRRLGLADGYGVPWRVVVGSADAESGQAELRRERGGPAAPGRVTLAELVDILSARHGEEVHMTREHGDVLRMA
ncbi:His/Gly/Thr/Pro-type tRNA ligase C-terminal domain-containing protein [Streptomyces longwoodensis]|uniref:His/Gly/Thr/Pro-type tRNA ligase C-terminal domain-containing protein n=1 Tax=Streptomyces longwoodensis TaxID=68231 RepID=UPI003408417C